MTRTQITLFNIVNTIICASLFLSNPSIATPQQHVYPYRGTSRPKKGRVIPQNDIQRFIKSLAIVNHYYIKKTTTSELFTYAIKGMLTQLDPHSSYLDATDYKDMNTTVSGQFVGIGVEITASKGALKIITPLDGTPAYKAGLKPNDLIVKVGDTLVQNMTLRQASNKIKGPKGSTVKLTIIRKNATKPLIFNIKRGTIKISSVKSKLLEPHYGYIRIVFFQGPVSKQLHLALNKLNNASHHSLRGLILDLRNNPGGLLQESAKVADTFLDAKTLKQYNNVIVYTKGRTKQSDMSIKDTSKDKTNHLPMVVLINEGSASAAEIVAGALQDYHRAIIMGTRSFGKGSVQSVIPITHDSAIKITTALYYTPSGRIIQSQGITPDVNVPEFKISKKSTALLNINESSFQGHLSNANGNKKQLKQKALIRKKEIKLAEKDYQLYRAVMMLKGVRALKKINLFK